MFQIAAVLSALHVTKLHSSGCHLKYTTKQTTLDLENGFWFKQDIHIFSSISYYSHLTLTTLSLCLPTVILALSSVISPCKSVRISLPSYPTEYIHEIVFDVSIYFTGHKMSGRWTKSGTSYLDN